MSTLPPRLLVPAKLFFEYAKKANVPAILFGGAASNLNSADRYTKDLDINVTDLKKISKHLGPPFTWQIGRAPTRLRVNYTHPTYAVKCDVASDNAVNLTLFMKYTAEYEDTGIRYALPPLLLADKIRTHAERSDSAEPKRVSDLSDIYLLIDRMHEQKLVVPEELVKVILNDTTLEDFYNSLPTEMDKMMMKEFLADVGLFLWVLTSLTTQFCNLSLAPPDVH